MEDKEWRRHLEPVTSQQPPETMKTKTTAKSKKPKIKVQDMKPKQDAKGGSTTGGAGAGKIKFNEFQIKKTTD